MALASKDTVEKELKSLRNRIGNDGLSLNKIADFICDRFIVTEKVENPYLSEELKKEMEDGLALKSIKDRLIEKWNRRARNLVKDFRKLGTKECLAFADKVEKLIIKGDRR